MTDLQGADLNHAVLHGAGLTYADLQGTNLTVADLQGAKFDKHTTLPDGTKWTPDTDMARFRDHNHPEFWRPSKE